MKIDLEKLWSHLPESTRFHVSRMGYSDVLAFAEGVAHAALDGNSPPYIDQDGRLIIPFDAPAKYRWWQGGQPVADTLAELNAPEEICAKYRHWRDK